MRASPLLRPLPSERLLPVIRLLKRQVAVLWLRAVVKMLLAAEPRLAPQSGEWLPLLVGTLALAVPAAARLVAVRPQETRRWQLATQPAAAGRLAAVLLPVAELLAVAVTELLPVAEMLRMAELLRVAELLLLAPALAGAGEAAVMLLAPALAGAAQAG